MKLLASLIKIHILLILAKGGRRLKLFIRTRQQEMVPYSNPPNQPANNQINTPRQDSQVHNMNLGIPARGGNQEPNEENPNPTSSGSSNQRK